LRKAVRRAVAWIAAFRLPDTPAQRYRSRRSLVSREMSD